jgi:hypothetical protein
LCGRNLLSAQGLGYGCLRKRHFLPKIVENNDHNIDSPQEPAADRSSRQRVKLRTAAAGRAAVVGAGDQGKTFLSKFQWKPRKPSYFCRHFNIPEAHS